MPAGKEMKLTVDEYVACRLLDMKLCINCLEPIEITERDYHCGKCLYVRNDIQIHKCKPCLEQVVRGSPAHNLILKNAFRG